MVLTAKQEQALKVAVDRYQHHDKYVVIGGAAGVGKSSLVRFIIDAIGIDENLVCYATFTGKAAEVLRKKGNKNAMTLHKLLYDSHMKPNGSYIHIPKRSIEYKVVVVDEVSMVPKTMIELLAGHNCFVICLGDPFQLPPINKNEDNHLLDHPHIFLDEIMRQAQESEIIRVSMDIRDGKPLKPFNGNEVMILPANEYNDDMMLWADQILVGTNATRIGLNNTIRNLLGRGSQPEDGDKIICLHNYWDILGSDKNPLVNGTIGYLDCSFSSFIKLPPWINYGKRIDVLHGDFLTDSNEKFENLEMDKKMILTGEKCVDYKTEYKVNINPKTKGILPLEFAYGYAITTWKAQGSQYSKVLVIEEGHPYAKTEHQQFLYTSLTRAEDKCVIVMKD